jgi:superfamily II DNA or RNA helicase
MEAGLTELHKGDEVRFRSDPDKTAIVKSDPYRRGGVDFIDVRVDDGKRSVFAVCLDEIELIVAPTTGRERLIAGQFSSIHHLSGRLTYEKLENPLRDVVYSLRCSRTEFQPYQFKPVLKFLESPANGLLIADEVGLGKTIEAGYILKELRARHRRDFRRSLVVCPAGLRVKWLEELTRRFAEPFEIADAAAVRKAAERVDRDGDGAEFFLIASYQTLRSPGVVGCVESLESINLTIVDEAHHFRNSATLTHALGETLREVSDNLVFLSATPVQLGDENLYTLLKLLAPDHIGDYNAFSEQFRAARAILQAARWVVSQGAERRDETLKLIKGLVEERAPGVPLTSAAALVTRLESADLSSREQQLELRSEIRELSPLATLMTRTRKSEVNAKGPLRIALLPQVSLSEDERRIYDFFTAEARERYGRAGGEGRQKQTARFRSVSLQQQMASCMPAFLSRRMSAGNGQWLYGDLRDADDLDEELSEEELEERDAAIHEARNVEESIGRVLEQRIDSKFDALLQILEKLDAEKPSGKVIVFSFFKPTLAYLEQRLAKLRIATQLISGDVPSRPDRPDQDERAARVRRFHEDPNVRVLLSSEVGSEGLDFQRASNVVIHYDLPWNPMKVEQRIGRVDRFGQPDPKVYTVSFKIDGTIEERIRETLYRRIGIFENTVGDLEDIVGSDVQRVEEIVMSPTLTEAERDRQLQLVADEAYVRLQERQRLEEIGDKLLGHDDSFSKELDLIELRGRSVSANELADFVEAELDVAGIRKVADRANGRRTRVDDTARLQDFIRRHIPRSALLRVSLLSERSDMPVDLVYDDPGAIQFITVDHPLTSAALSARRARISALEEPVAAVAIQSGLVPPGTYVFSMARLTDIGAVRGSYSIVSAAVSLCGPDVPSDVADQIIREARERGRDLPSLHQPEGEVRSAINRLDLLLTKQRKERENELRTQHGRSKQMRLESVRSKFESELRRVEARIGDKAFPAKAERYQRMMRGRRLKLRDELSRIDTEFASQSVPTVALQMFAYGLVEVSQ